VIFFFSNFYGYYDFDFRNIVIEDKHSFTLNFKKKDFKNKIVLKFLNGIKKLIFKICFKEVEVNRVCIF
jgi:hypothetical protein